MKFITKPVIVEAYQFTGNRDNPGFPSGWVPGAITGDGGEVLFRTPDGIKRARKGDWIIKAPDGEFYYCAPDVFKESYDCIIDAEIISDEIVIDTKNNLQ